MVVILFSFSVTWHNDVVDKTSCHERVMETSMHLFPYIQKLGWILLHHQHEGILPSLVDLVPRLITSLLWGWQDQLVQPDKGRVISTIVEEAPASVYTIVTTSALSFGKSSALGLVGEALWLSLGTFLQAVPENSLLGVVFLFKQGTFGTTIIFFYWSPKDIPLGLSKESRNKSSTWVPSSLANNFVLLAAHLLTNSLFLFTHLVKSPLLSSTSQMTFTMYKQENYINIETSWQFKIYTNKKQDTYYISRNQYLKLSPSFKIFPSLPYIH